MAFQPRRDLDRRGRRRQQLPDGGERFDSAERSLGTTVCRPAKTLTRGRPGGRRNTRSLKKGDFDKTWRGRDESKSSRFGGRLNRGLPTSFSLVFSPKTNAANERLAQHLWAHRDALFTFLRQPGLDATNWRAELAIRFGVILRKVWGGSRTWAGARAQAVLRSVWRTCWQQGRSALNFLSQLLRGTPVPLALPP
jgi:hypothetical protein